MVRGAEGATSLHCATRRGEKITANILLKHDAEIEARETQHKYTPLLEAASVGCLPIVKALLKAGANVDAKGSEPNHTPLHLAVWRKDLPIVQVLWMQVQILRQRRAYTIGLLYMGLSQKDINLSAKRF